MDGHRRRLTVEFARDTQLGCREPKVGDFADIREALLDELRNLSLEWVHA